MDDPIMGRVGPFASLVFQNPPRYTVLELKWSQPDVDGFQTN